MGKDLHKRSISSLNDIEKDKLQKDFNKDFEKGEMNEEYEDDENPKKSKKIDYFLILVIFFLVGTLINFIVITKKSNSNNLKLKNLNNKEINKLLNIDNINLEDVENNEIKILKDSNNKNLETIEELDKQIAKIEYEIEGEQQQQHIPIHSDSVSTEIESTIQQPVKLDVVKSINVESFSDAQKDLAEILSINPIIIIENEENTKLQLKVENILQNLKITPEVKIIKLNKHPNYKRILEYLKNFSLINSGNEYHTYDDEEIDIPRLFIGGSPKCNYNDILIKYKNNELNDYLKEHGKGLINLVL